MRRMLDAHERIKAFEERYTSPADGSLCVDLVEYYPAHTRYLGDVREFWSASRDYVRDLLATEAA